jgi:hypothetical protein
MKADEKVLFGNTLKEYFDFPNPYENISFLFAVFWIIFMDGLEISAALFGIRYLYLAEKIIIITPAIIGIPILIVILNTMIILLVMKIFRPMEKFLRVRNGLKNGIVVGNIFAIFFTVVGIVVLLSQQARIIDPCACF